MNGIIYLVIGVVCFVSYSDSRPNGAPQDSCFYMTPRHIHPHTFRRVFPTKAMGLYNITTSADVFRPDRPIRVTLWGPPFKGFMLVAAEEGAKDWPAGIFYSEDGAAKRVSCLARGDTVTHQNSSYKDSVSVLWYGPENMMSEQIQFIATVVVNLTIYYTNIRSGMLRLDPTLHGYTTPDTEAAGAGAEGAPVAVTMDPWLSGQSVTQAPSLNLWGAGGRQSQSNTWGSNTGAPSSWGSNTGAPSWGSNTQGTWGQGQQSSANSWGTNGNNGWSQANGGNSGWGTQGGSNQWSPGSQSQNGWQSQGTGTQWRNPGSVTPKAQQQQQPTKQAPNAGATGNSWGNTGSGSDWQQWGQGSVTSSQWSNGQVVWNAPGDGRPIWHWNSGSITTKKPAQTPAPSGGSGAPWSASNILGLLQQFGKK
ncbi:DOMON domain-containing protein frrs1L [Mactra antiquata]